MSLNPFQNYSWNYSKQDKDDYSPELIGTVVTMQEVQSYKFDRQTGKRGAPEFWDDGDPKLNIRIGVITPEGNFKTFTFQPASSAAKRREKPSIHMDLWDLTGDTQLTNLLGKTIRIWTEPGNYGAGHPRPWWCELRDDGPYQPCAGFEIPDEYKVPVLLAKKEDKQQQQGVAPANIAPQQTMGYQQGYQAIPMQQQYVPQQQYQPRYQQPPMSQQYQQAPVQQQASMQPQQQMPQGMDPQVAAAMQAAGEQNIQQVDNGPSDIYGDEIPF